MSVIRNTEVKIINNFKIEYNTWNHNLESDKKIDDLINTYLYHNNWNKFIKPGSNVIDIGAHSGDTLIPIILSSSD
jgi:hypothetical protein